MTSQSIRPEDILPDGIDSTELNGKTVRKGTIAAFLANAEILEDAKVSEEIKQAALTTMKKLAPDVIAIGLHKHVIFKKYVVEQILNEAK